MPMDALCLSAVLAETERNILGGRIDKIHQPSRDEILLHIRGKNGPCRLLLSANPSRARIQLTALPRENPAEPPMFCMLLRKYLSGGKILDLRQPPAERLAELVIEATNEMGDKVRRRLILEMMGRRTNLLLLDGEDRIVDCLRRVEGDLTQARPLLPGMFYHLPDPQPGKKNPNRLTEEDRAALLAQGQCDTPADKFLLDHFMNRRAEEETYDIVFGSQEWQDLDRGIITREEANKIMLEKAAHANRVFEVQTCLDEWFTMLETNKTTVQIMRKLKAAGYRLYYLTNIPTDVMDELRQREWFTLFDGGIASCDVHLCKPEPEIFTTLMQTCHLAYDESIFVDDNKANAQAAYNLGITGILYKNPKSFTRALGACGIEVE